MDTNGSEGTWTSDGYADTRNNFVEQSSAAEYAKYGEDYGDSPPSVKSRDAILLTEAEKQLEATESKYVSAMARLRYLKLLYDTAGSMSPNDYNRTDESAITEKNSQSDASLGLQLTDERNCEKNGFTSGDARYHGQESGDVERAVQAESELAEQSPMYTATSIKITSEQNIFHDATNKDSHDWDGQNPFSESAKGGRTNFLYADSMENSETDHTNRMREEHSMGDNFPRIQHPYQQHLAEYSKGLQDELEEELRKNAESPKLDDQFETLRLDALKSSRQQDSKEPALHLNLSESVETVQTRMKNKRLRNKQRRVSSKIALKSIDDTAGPILKRKRKKHGGVKTSNSRCTTATRDTGISENKKDFRSKKQKGPSTILRLQSQNRRQDVSTRIEKGKSEVVEIYHNAAVKSGSLSVVSSKHSKVMDSRVRGFNPANKLDQPWRTRGSYRLVENNDQGKRVCDDIEEQKSRKQQNGLTEPTENCENEYEELQDNLVETRDFRSGEPNSNNYQADYSANQSENKVAKEYGDRHHRHNRQSPHNCSSPCYDLVSSRNYELPTVSSRLKQVHKSYFNRFNFKSIPFVVGTSITPSYNLGLNIQEALNLMKTRQILSSGVPPMIISHVTKGIKPVSRLFECTHDENEMYQLGERNTPCNASSRVISNVHPDPALTEKKISRSVPQGAFHLKTPRLNFIPDTETLYEARPCTNPKIELTARSQKSRSICLSMKSNLQKAEAKPQLTRSTLLRQRQDEINSGDAQPMKWQNVTQNTKGIREVLLNFHDQYEAMISKFEKLQDQAKKTNDKSLDKEIAALEKELNAKEEEINAVASLYQEVMILKEQMKMLHERNSLVCVTTESPRGPTSPHFAIRAQTTNPIRMMNFYRRGGSFGNQGPPTSTKLAGLLRQIKTFQKQLKSTT